MTTQRDQLEVEKGEVKPAPKDFPQEDFDLIADHIFEVWTRRKNKRRDDLLDKKWAEIDRQLRMEPNNVHKVLPNGRPDLNRMWMAEMELPLQAQTLETLTADARRLTIPDSGTWYEPTVEISDDYAEKLQGFSIDPIQGAQETGDVPAARIAGDANEIPALFLQTQANQLLSGIQDYFRSQYDFGQSLDKINAEAFKYGTGVGRGRVVTKAQILSLASGDIRETTKFPALIPVSIKDLYLDDSPHAVLHEGHAIDTGIIQHRKVKLEDIVIAANKGSSNPNAVDGGWMPTQLTDVKPKRNKHVELLEFEGDLIVPRKSAGSIVLEGVIVTVVIGQTGKADNRRMMRRVVRFRFRKTPFSSYLTWPYHCEEVSDAYATSPLMKGRPLQMAAVDALNRLLDSAAIRNSPPVSYDRSDMWFAEHGGPRIHPYANWATVGEVRVHSDIGGDPGALGAMLTNLVQFYYDVTGVQPARLGEQTRSHTTAFAKNVELQTGQARTVDYVRNSLKGPLTRWLYMEKDLLKLTLTTSPQSVFIPAYQAWMEVTRDALPDNAWYNAIGASGPLEAAQKRAERFQSAQQALAIDNLRVQLGQQPVLDTAKFIDAILSEGGWTDIDALKSEQAVAGGQPGAPQAGAPGDGSAAPAAIQALALQAGAGS